MTHKRTIARQSTHDLYHWEEGSLGTNPKGKFGCFVDEEGKGTLFLTLCKGRRKEKEKVISSVLS